MQLEAEATAGLDQLCINTIRVPSIARCRKLNQVIRVCRYSADGGVLWTRFLTQSEKLKWLGRIASCFPPVMACASVFFALPHGRSTVGRATTFSPMGLEKPGHPETFSHGVEITTGPWGRALPTAWAWRWAAPTGAKFNKDGFPLAIILSMRSCLTAI
jgi:hypothetical protein